MSSIRERAAALHLAEKLCVRPPAHGGSSKPVQSSSVWSGLISHLRSSVTVKRRRVGFRSHSDCFLGSEAVDVLAAHISCHKDFQGASVSRDRLVCVCQALLDRGVFEAVGTRVFGKDKKQDVFQDSRSALYRFEGVCCPSVEELETGELEQGIQRLFCSAPSDRQEEQTCPSGSHDQTSSPVRLTPTSIKEDQLASPASVSLSLQPLGDSVSPSRVQTDSLLPAAVVEEVWQEQTLLRLLNLVELPVLEGVLQCSQTPPPPSDRNPDLVYSSSLLDRHILKAFNDSQEDAWLCAGLDCLDFLPDQPVVELSRELLPCFPQNQDHQVAAGSSSQPAVPSVSCVSSAANTREEQSLLSQSGLSQSGVSQSGVSHSGLSQSGLSQSGVSQSGLSQSQLLLYGTLVKHYGDRAPLLPHHMADIYSVITDLLVNAKLAAALEALQLSLKLLPAVCRDELRRLLTFMSLAADPQGVRLDQEVSNRLAVKRSFSRAILHTRVLQKDREDLMVVFMLSNIKDIFKIPGALHKAVSERLAGLEQGTQPGVSGVWFCQQVSTRTYSDSTRRTTSQELLSLLSSIHLDPRTSSRDRKRLLGRFYQAHPHIFNQYFGESAVNLL
ncbi:DEP domain-containing protein 7-like [Centropristis striata]|uniref:DEP domain-containing protein 7-like n=1 Tax=Centropristis striata TaxID=184440 RepID=UPI0027DEB701|nr:DEP domain-containing protein 7-like [Centropristis striata]